MIFSSLCSGVYQGSQTKGFPGTCVKSRRNEAHNNFALQKHFIVIVESTEIQSLEDRRYFIFCHVLIRKAGGTSFKFESHVFFFPIRVF